MIRAFADTFFWIAPISPPDSAHDLARRFESRLALGDSMVTTEETLLEVLASFSASGPYWRVRTAEFVRRLRLSRPPARVIPQSHASFEAGLALYRQRPDKGYSLVDCISMETMRQEGLTAASTNDRHFAQEGFERLFAD